MSLARQIRLVSVDEYLAAESESTQKHEYVAGVVYAMEGASNAHNQLATNATIALGSRLRGQECRVFNSDTRIRLRLPTQVRFYYPDLSVICRTNPLSDLFQDEPSVIVEVLSSSTRRVDEGEKKEAYLTLPSLDVYLLVESEQPVAVAFRRTEQGFQREVYEGLDTTLPLPEIHCEVPLAEIYDGVLP